MKVQNSTSSRVSSLWSTNNYPADCNAYYSTVSASPSASSAWNASQNTAFFSSAYDCLLSINSYVSASESFQKTDAWVWWTTVVSVETEWIDTYTYTTTSYELTTLCDGIPRAVTTEGAKSSSTTYTSTAIVRNATTTTYNSTYSTSTAPFTTPPPMCSLGCNACSMLYAAADWSQSSYDAKSDYTAEVAYPFDCPSAPDPDDTNKDGLEDCQVQVWSAQLFYWPVSTTNGNVCNKTGTTITATPTGDGPNTYNLNGTILTSPTVYVSFYNLSYESIHYNHTYSYVTDTLMSFNATDISSQRGYHGSDGTFSFDYADLPPNPVPSSAWFGQAICWFDSSECIPMATTAYAPALAFPSVFYNMSNLNPQWTAKQCALGVEGDGVWDPPVACQSASSVVGPALGPAIVTTTTSVIETTKPAPSATPTQPASQTSASDPMPASTSVGSAPATASATAEAQSNVADTTEASLSNPTSVSVALDTTTPTKSQSSNFVVDGNTASPSGNGHTASSQGSTSRDVGGIIASALGMSRSSAISAVLTTQMSSSQQQEDPNATDNVGTTSQTGTLPNVVGTPTSVIGDILGSSWDTTTSVQSHAAPSATSAGSIHAPSVTGQDNSPSDDSPSDQSAVLTIGGSTWTAATRSDGDMIIGGTTVAPSQTVTLGNQVVSINAAGEVVDGTSTLTIPHIEGNTGTAASDAIFTAGNSVYTAVDQGSGVVVVAQSTLSKGGAPLTLGDQIVSADSSAVVIDGTKTVALSPTGRTDDAVGQAIVFTAGSATYTATALRSGVLVVAQHTVSVGGAPLTLDNQVVSADRSGVVIDGTKTVALSPAGSTYGSAEQVVVFTAGSATYTATEHSSGLVGVDQSTLSVGGPPTTLGSEVVSAASSGLVLDGTTTLSFSSEVPAGSSSMSTPSSGQSSGTASGSVAGAIQGSESPSSNPSVSIAVAASNAGYRNMWCVDWRLMILLLGVALLGVYTW